MATVTQTITEEKNNLRTYTFDEVAQHDGRDGSMWTIVNDQVYDFTSFYGKHPGGDIIKLAAGRDSTPLLESHHTGDAMKTVVDKYLKTILIGKLDKSVQRLSSKKNLSPEFYETLRTRVDKYFASKKINQHGPELLAMTEFFLTISLYYLVSLYKAHTLNVFAAIIVGFLTGRLGFLMHMGNHHGISSFPIFNKIVGWSMTIIGGSHLVWRNEHQVAHHMDPNELGKDNDCSIGDPVIKFHPELAPHSWHKYNSYMTVALMTGGFIKWYFADPFNVASGRVGSVTFKPSTSDWIGLALGKGSWFLLHVVYPYYVSGNLLRVLLLDVLFMAIAAHYLENIFIVNHIQAGLVPPKEGHWAARQVLSTANWSSGSKFWNWFSGGLNHQVEHHLFPSTSHYLYPEIAPIVRQTCKEYDLPYNNYEHFGSAWWAMFTYLKSLGQMQHVHAN